MKISEIQADAMILLKNKNKTFQFSRNIMHILFYHHAQICGLVSGNVTKFLCLLFFFPLKQIWHDKKGPRTRCHHLDLTVSINNKL